MDNNEKQNDDFLEALENSSIPTTTPPVIKRDLTVEEQKRIEIAKEISFKQKEEEKKHNSDEKDLKNMSIGGETAQKSSAELFEEQMLANQPEFVDEESNEEENAEEQFAREMDNFKNEDLPEPTIPPRQLPETDNNATVIDALAKLQEDGKIEESPKLENTNSNDEKIIEPDTHPINDVTDDNLIKIENKTESSEKDTKNSERTVEILNSTEMEHVEKTNKNKDDKSKVITSGDNLVDDNLDERLYQQNREIAAAKYKDDYNITDDEIPNITASTINEIIEKEYDDTDIGDNKPADIEVSIIDEDEDSVNTKVETVTAKETEETPSTPATLQYYGGDGKLSAFKIRTSKVTKILRNVEVPDTDKIDAVDISKKPLKEQQDIYLNTVLPTLQPSYAVVPFIISGVVITMTAFTWPDIMEITKIEEKAYENLDPSDDDYIYQKNKIFLEKRRKQIDLFYNHIFTVSGFEVKPSKDELFGKIIKFPDFPQLFFAAYAASFQKPYQFTLVCSTCGTEQEKNVVSKDLCFLLNKNINIDSLNHYIKAGSSLGAKETAELYKEFQKEKIVEMANATYRTDKKLPVSSFVYELKVPTVYEALETLDEVVELFRNKPLEYTDDEGSTISVDSAFGLNNELIEIRSYLYLKTLIVGRVVSEDKSSNSAKVGFVSFVDKNSIINSVYNLSSEDHKQLFTDQKLHKLLGISGIRHAIKAGKCVSEVCNTDMGIISVEPETLFFTIAQRESIN